MSEIQSQPNWFKRYAYPLTVFSISRIGIFLFAHLSLVLIPIKTGIGLWRNYPQNLFLDGWARWDSGWFSTIIQNGYTNIATLGQQRDTAFFPLYPIAVRVISAFSQNISSAGIFISNISFLMALLLLYQIVHDQYGKDTAERSVVLLALNPFSLFFSAMYSESFFLLTIMCAFLFAERKRWVWAGLSAAAAGATRVVGIVAAIGLVLVYLEQIGFAWRKIRANILWLLVGLVGPGSYMLFLWMKFGNPLQFIKSQYVPGWGEGVNFQSAIETIKALFSPGAIITGQIPGMEVFHLFAFIIAVVVLALVVRRLRPAYMIWAVLTILASFSLWRSMGRFLIVVFPLYIATALLFTGKKFEFVLGISCLFLGLFTILFTHWYWVA
jgi:Gpi18-like mannosyltransferase